MFSQHFWTYSLVAVFFIPLKLIWNNLPADNVTWPKFLVLYALLVQLYMCLSCQFKITLQGSLWSEYKGSNQKPFF